MANVTIQKTYRVVVEYNSRDVDDTNKAWDYLNENYGYDGWICHSACGGRLIADIIPEGEDAEIIEEVI